MLKVSLDQFMVDYYTPDDYTEVQSIWLQDKLKKLAANSILAIKLQDKLDASEKTIAYLKDRISQLEQNVTLSKRKLDVCV